MAQCSGGSGATEVVCAFEVVTVLILKHECSRSINAFCVKICKNIFSDEAVLHEVCLFHEDFSHLQFH